MTLFSIRDQPALPRVQGHCPHGCGKTLHLAPRGLVVCIAFDCPNPWAVSRILANPETEHLALLTEDNVVLKHPLRERIEDDLFGCTLYERIKAWGVSESPGTYRVTVHEDGSPRLERLDG